MTGLQLKRNNNDIKRKEGKKKLNRLFSTFLTDCDEVARGSAPGGEKGGKVGGGGGMWGENREPKNNSTEKQKDKTNLLLMLHVRQSPHSPHIADTSLFQQLTLRN